ncbi:MAG: DUF4190 domain-containing protein [Zavarzinella sp.]
MAKVRGYGDGDYDDDEYDDLPPRRRRRYDDYDDDDYDDYDDRPRRSLQPHRGAIILVFGLLGFLICGFFGIAAWIMGKNDLAEMKQGRMDPDGKGLTLAGYILGSICVIMNVLVIIAVVAVILLDKAAN